MEGEDKRCLGGRRLGTDYRLDAAKKILPSLRSYVRTALPVTHDLVQEAETIAFRQENDLVQVPA